MFAILEKSIERKKHYQDSNKEETVHLVEVLEQSPDISSLPKTNPISKSQIQSASIQSKPPVLSNSNENQTTETKPKTYMERIREQANLFHAKHTPTLTIKKKPKSRDILKEEDDFSLLQVDSSVIQKRCPVLSDILMLCMSSAPSASREELCRVHKDRLDNCLDHEMRIEFERQIHSNCSSQFKALSSGKIEKNLAYNDLVNCLREQIVKPTSVII